MTNGQVKEAEAKITEAKIRARKIIGNFQGLEDEFAMLKGVLCAYHSWSCEETQSYRELIDTSLIAERMDELQKIAGRPDRQGH